MLDDHAIPPILKLIDILSKKDYLAAAADTYSGVCPSEIILSEQMQAP
jgi:hypothetical protein